MVEDRGGARLLLDFWEGGCVLRRLRCADSPKRGWGGTDSGEVPSPDEMTVYQGCKETPPSATAATDAFVRHCQGARSRADGFTENSLGVG